jgi:hypothetical protein
MKSLGNAAVAEVVSEALVEHFPVAVESQAMIRRAFSLPKGHSERRFAACGSRQIL